MADPTDFIRRAVEQVLLSNSLCTLCIDMDSSRAEAGGDEIDLPDAGPSSSKLSLPAFQQHVPCTLRLLTKLVGSLPRELDRLLWQIGSRS